VRGGTDGQMRKMIAKASLIMVQADEDVVEVSCESRVARSRRIR
jgi:hypothetical protein